MLLNIFSFSQQEPLTGLMKSSGFTARNRVVVRAPLSPGFLSLGVSFPCGVLLEDISTVGEYLLKTKLNIYKNELEELHSYTMPSACLLPTQPSVSTCTTDRLGHYLRSPVKAH